MERTKKIVLFLILIFLIVRLLQTPDQAAAAIRDGVSACLNHIIPSLFAMMAISEILVRSGVYRYFGVLFRPIARYMLRQSDTEFAIFLLSQFAGYPVGIAMLTAAVKRGEISAERACRLCLFCVNSGPAFLISLVGIRVYGTAAAGWLIYGANVLMNLLLAFLLRGKSCTPTKPAKITADSFCSALVEGTRAASKNMAQICALMLIMKCFHTAIAPLIPAIVPTQFTAGFLEVSQISAFPMYCTSYLPVISALSAFGGICVLLQLYAVGGNLLQLRAFLTARICAAGGAYALCYFLMPYVMKNYTVPTFSGRLHAAAPQNPLLSVILVAMTAMLLLESLQLKKKKHPVSGTECFM